MNYKIKEKATRVSNSQSIIKPAVQNMCCYFHLSTRVVVWCLSQEAFYTVTTHAASKDFFKFQRKRLVKLKKLNWWETLNSQNQVILTKHRQNRCNQVNNTSINQDKSLLKKKIKNFSSFLGSRLKLNLCAWPLRHTPLEEEKKSAQINLMS